MVSTVLCVIAVHPRALFNYLYGVLGGRAWAVSADGLFVSPLGRIDAQHVTLLSLSYGQHCGIGDAE